MCLAIIKLILTYHQTILIWTRIYQSKTERHQSLNVYKNSQFEKSVSSTNLNLSVGQRVFHQKFGMGFIISSDGDKLNINFDKAGEKKVVSSFIKIIE